MIRKNYSTNSQITLCKNPTILNDYNNRVAENDAAMRIVKSNMVPANVIDSYNKAYQNYVNAINAIPTCDQYCVGGSIKDGSCVCPAKSPVPYLQNGTIYCVNQDCSSPNTLAISDVSHLKSGVCSCALSFSGPLCLTNVKNVARYIRIQRIMPHSDGIINIGELQVFDQNNVNVAQGKAATSKTVYMNNPIFDASKLVDGNPSTFYHSQPNGVGEWVMVDLGSLISISRINVINRQDCCQNRAAGLQLQLYVSNPSVSSSKLNLPVQMINFGNTIKNNYDWTFSSSDKIPFTIVTVAPTVAPSSEWYSYNNSYISNGEYNSRTYVNSLATCYQSCKSDPNCAAAYAYNGPEMGGRVECSRVPSHNVPLLYNRFGTMTNHNPGNRHVIVNKARAGSNFRSNIGTPINI